MSDSAGPRGAGTTAPIGPVPTSLFTDHYELTMVAAALADGTAARQCVFELFARRLPDGRRYGVVAGTGRLLESINRFRFGDQELAVLDGVVSPILYRILFGTALDRERILELVDRTLTAREAT